MVCFAVRLSLGWRLGATSLRVCPALVLPWVVVCHVPFPVAPVRGVVGASRRCGVSALRWWCPPPPPVVVWCSAACCSVSCLFLRCAWCCAVLGWRVCLLLLPAPCGAFLCFHLLSCCCGLCFFLWCLPSSCRRAPCRCCGAVLLAVVLCPPPLLPSVVAPCVLPCCACCWVVPWSGVRCFVLFAVFTCALLCCVLLVYWCFAAWCVIVLCCWFRRWPSPVGVGFAVCLGVLRCPLAPCCLVRCCVLCGAVVRCCVMWCFLRCCVVSWCVVSSEVPLAYAALCWLRRIFLIPPPPVCCCPCCPAVLCVLSCCAVSCCVRGAVLPCAGALAWCCSVVVSSVLSLAPRASVRCCVLRCFIWRSVVRLCCPIVWCRVLWCPAAPCCVVCCCAALWRCAVGLCCVFPFAACGCHFFSALETASKTPAVSLHLCKRSEKKRIKMFLLRKSYTTQHNREHQDHSHISDLHFTRRHPRRRCWGYCCLVLVLVLDMVLQSLNSELRTWTIIATCNYLRCCKALTQYPPGPSTCSAKGGKNGEVGAQTGGVGTWRTKEGKTEKVQGCGILQKLF